MMKTLKAFTVSLVLVGAAMTSAGVLVPTSAVVTPPFAVENLSVQLTATYTFQGNAKTNAHDGTITDVKGMVTITTPKFIQLLATNLGITNLSREATLIKVTELALGTNFTNVITNSTTLVSNTTFLITNYDPTNFVYENNTNATLLITNSSPIIPAGYFLSTASGTVTNLVQATGNKIIVGTNVQYFINNGPGLNTNNFIPIRNTNDNAGGIVFAGDDAPNFINNGVALDDQNNPAEQNFQNFGLTTNFFLAQNLTNLGHIFAGTIKTNLAITGTLYGDTINIGVGPPRATNGAPAPPQINNFLTGTANATAVSANVGSGKSAVPFSSWNASFPVTGSGKLGATVTNTLNTQQSYYVYTSNGTIFGGTLFSGQNTSVFTYGTNPPPVILSGTNTQGYTNIGTNYYTNYSVVNPTNITFVFTGKVTESFVKIVQP